MTTSAMTSVRKKWKSRPAWIRFTWNETRRTMGSSRTARNGHRRTRATPARTCLTGRPSAGAPSAQCGGEPVAATRGCPGLPGSARSGHNAGMALLRYTVITSLDGYVNDAEGGFSWAEPSDELHEVVNDPRAGGRHLPARPAAVRDDALLGDRPRRRARPDGRVRPDLAGGRQGRLLHQPRRRRRRPAPGSPRRSTRPRSRPSRPRACSTSASAARPSRPRRSAPAWSTTCTCSCTRCSSVAAPGRCPTTSTPRLDLVSVDRVGDVVHLHHRVRR